LGWRETCWTDRTRRLWWGRESLIWGIRVQPASAKVVFGRKVSTDRVPQGRHRRRASRSGVPVGWAWVLPGYNRPPRIPLSAS